MTRERFQKRPRATPRAAPNDAGAFEEELRKIELRLDLVSAAGRASFVDGSTSFDHATVAILRLAALLERGSRFAQFFEAATDDEKRGIATTRNIAAHVGYASMDLDAFWHTMTVDVPVFIAKIREVNHLPRSGQ